MSSLYELSREYRDVIDRLDDEENADNQNTLLLSLIACLEQDVEIKIVNIVKFIANEQMLAEGIELEINTLRAKKKARENRVESLRNYLRDFMQVSGLTRFNAGIRKLSISKGRKRLEVDEGQVSAWPAPILDAAIESGAVIERVEVRKKLVAELPDYLNLPGVTEVEGEPILTIR